MGMTNPYPSCNASGVVWCRELDLRQEEIRAMDLQDELAAHKIEEIEAQVCSEGCPAARLG